MKGGVATSTGVATSAGWEGLVGGLGETFSSPEFRFTWTYLALLTTLLSLPLLASMVSSLLMITQDIPGCI